MRVILFFILLFFTCLNADEVALEKLHPWHNQLQVGKIHRFQRDGEYFLGVITSIEERLISVKLIDHTIPLDAWSETIFAIEELVEGRPRQHRSLDELIACFRENKVIVTDAIEAAFRAIDRKHFCPIDPYFDFAASIGHDVCISTPSMHAWALELTRDHLEDASAILDVGSGSGYLTACFAYLAPNVSVVGMEYIKELAIQSEEVITNHVPPDVNERITIIEGDGELGYPEKGPYDVIHVGFMCEEIPEQLLKQLKCGGRLIVPVGKEKNRTVYDNRCVEGEFMVVDKLEDGTFKKYSLFPCFYVPSQTKEF